jgi:hypothetical protein
VPEADHAAEPLHLARGDIVPWMLRQAGIDHLCHLRMAGEEVDHLLGVVAVPVHPDAEGLQAAVGQEAVEGAGHGAHRVLVEGDRLRQVEVSDHDGAADHVAVPTDVLGRRVHHDVGAEGERLLQIRRREGVVDDQQRAGLVGDLSEPLDVGDGQQRVGRGLDPQDLRLPGPDRGAYRVDVADVGGAVLETPTLRDLVEEPEGAAVRVVGDHGVVAGAGEPPQDGVLGRQAAGEREPALPFLQRRERALERGPRRVGAAAVLVAAAQPTDAVLLVGARRVDGRDHRAGGRVGLVAGMDGAGLEPGLAAMVLSHPTSVVVAAGNRWGAGPRSQ